MGRNCGKCYIRTISHLSRRLQGRASLIQLEVLTMTSFNPIRKWFLPGRDVRHNYDPGVFRVVEVDLDGDAQSSYLIHAPIEYAISCCRPA